ncbi:CPBP family intramembrane glutamic endopeptidase [Trujillonella humicola]|uniref:CPBP family intramembrane glutamic endopeptidase n=1 Tax=Trujillonella humicola TaxID=3383699 RepID=UPI0039067F9A
MTWAGGPVDGEADDGAPYTGPPPTAPYGAPPRVPGALPGLHPPLPHGAAGPVPWPLGPVPMPPGPHTHLPGPPPGGPPPGGAPPAWGPQGGGPPAWGPQGGGPPAWQPGGGPPPWGHPGWGPPPWALPPPLPHDVPTSFLQMMRTRTWRWWRPLLGLLLFAVVYAVVAVAVVLVGAVGLVTRSTVDLEFADLADPWVLLVTNVSLAVAIPVVWLAWVAAHSMRIGSSSSVLGRLRWDLVRRYVPLALATLGVGIGVQVALGLALDDGLAVAGPTRSFAGLLLVVVLTTPLQSAAEEYVFRGYLSQAIAAWVGRERAGALVAAVITATLFSVAHVPGDFLLFLDRFAFGLAASAVVWLTGGLEAAIVLHAVNNVLVFVLAGALGEGVETDATVTGWAGLLIVVLDVLAMAAFVLLVRRSAARRPPGTRTAAQDLRPWAAAAPR